MQNEVQAVVREALAKGQTHEQIGRTLGVSARDVGAAAEGARVRPEANRVADLEGSLIRERRR